MQELNPPRATDLAAAAWIIEQLLLREEIQTERSRIRRAVDESAETYGLPEPGEWHQWFVEACHSLGRTCRILDATASQLAEFARDGAVVVVRNKDGVWRSFVGRRFRSIRLLTASSERPTRKISASGLKRLLFRDGFQQLIRCVVIEPASVTVNSATAHEPEGSPLSRVISLLRAEQGDIWVIVAFALVSGLLGITTPLAVEALVNTVAFGRFLQPIIVLSLMLMAFLLFQAALKALQKFVVEIIQRRLFARIVADLSFRLPRTTPAGYEGSYLPELMNRFFDIVTVQKIVAELLLDGVSVILSTVVGMMVLAFYHPYLLAFDIVLILLLLFTAFVLGRGAVKTSIKESKTKYAMAAWLEDLARCPTTFRHDGAAEFAMERSNQLIFHYLTARKKHFWILMRQVVFLLLMQALASTALLGIGGWLVISGQLSLGQLVAAELIVAIVVGSFAKLGKYAESFYDLLASIDKLGILLDLKMERADGMLTMPVTGDIVATSLSFHGDDPTAVFEDLTFTIEERQHTALIGMTGAGPRMLFEILFGLRESASGVVTIHGANPRDLRPDVLRKRLALARDREIFEGTIAENVHLARPGVTMSHVRAALDRVGLLPAVLRFPAGMETPLIPSGAPLSPAAQCRLIIARALAGQPNYVFIDALLDQLPDAEGEQILDRLLAEDTTWTILLATNRETLRNRMTQTVVVNDHIKDL